MSSAGISAELAAPGSANEFVPVGGESGSSEQRNEGRLLVSEMASGLQQQEAELCRPSLFCSLYLPNLLLAQKNVETQLISLLFFGHSKLSVLYLHFVDTLLKSGNTSGPVYNHLNPSLAAFNRALFFQLSRECGPHRDEAEAPISVTGSHVPKTKHSDLAWTTFQVKFCCTRHTVLLLCFSSFSYFKSHFQVLEINLVN